MSLFSALSVSASGMAAQRTRAALLVENIANSETTRTPDGGPYRRKDAIFSSDEPVFGVRLRTGFRNERQQPPASKSRNRRGQQRVRKSTILPGHPDADAGWLCVHAANQPSRRDGEPDGCDPRLSGECGRHVRREGHDSEIDRSVAIGDMRDRTDLKHHSHLTAAHDSRRPAPRASPASFKAFFRAPSMRLQSQQNTRIRLGAEIPHRRKRGAAYHRAGYAEGGNGVRAWACKSATRWSTPTRKS